VFYYDSFTCFARSAQLLVLRCPIETLQRSYACHLDGNSSKEMIQTSSSATHPELGSKTLLKTKGKLLSIGRMVGQMLVSTAFVQKTAFCTNFVANSAQLNTRGQRAKYTACVSPAEMGSTKKKS